MQSQGAVAVPEFGFAKEPHGCSFNVLLLRSKAEGVVRESVEGRGQVIENEKEVAQSLFEYYSKVPQVAKYVQIGLGAAGKPILADCERAAQKMVVVRIDLT